MNLETLFDEPFLDHSDKVKKLELENNTLSMKRTDPYGFVKISFAKGQVPEHLRGDYTSFEEARKAIDVYLREKGRKILSET